MVRVVHPQRAGIYGGAVLEPVGEGFCFTEGPRWHDGRLFFSDIHGRQVMELDRAGTSRLVVEVEGRPSGLGWLPDGRLLVVSMDDRRVLRLDATGLVVHAELAPLGLLGANDMIVDGEGRAYVSVLGYDPFGPAGHQIGPSVLVAVTPDGVASIAAGDLIVPNGVALTADGRTMVVAESGGCRLTAFDVGADGQLSGRRLFAPLEQGDYPDGMCLDREDAAWVACPVSRRVVRVVEGGTYTDVVTLDGETHHPIACVLGDDDRRTLYVCTSPTLGDPEASVAARGARIERTRVTVAGAGRP